MEFEEQVSTSFRCKGGQEHAALLPACDGPTVFAIVWAQATEHKGTWFSKGKPQAIPMMIIDMHHADSLWEHNVKAHWTFLRAVVVRLDVSATALSSIGVDLRELLRTVAQHGRGPAKNCGLFTGGGYVHSNFATRLRKLPSLQKVWNVLAEADGRPILHPGRLVAMAEPVLLSELEDRPALSTGSENGSTQWHVDTQVVDGAPGLHHLQAAVILKGFKQCRGYARVGCITSLFPPTAFIAQQCNLSMATRYSQVEDGRCSRRPLERPVTTTVLGGSFRTMSKAEKMSAQQVETYVRQSTSLAPVVPYDAKEQARCNNNFAAEIGTMLGSPLPSYDVWTKKVARGLPWRKGAVLGLAIGVSIADLWAKYPKFENAVAQRVFKHAKDRLDLAILRAWCFPEVGKRRQLKKQKIGAASLEASKQACLQH